MTCRKSTCKANALLRQYGAVIPNPDFQPAIELLGYILKIDDYSKYLQARGTEDWKYHSFESLLLDFGRFFKPSQTVEHLRTDLANRFRYVASQQSEKHIYAEGIVLKPDGVAFEHAWVMDKGSGLITDVYFKGLAYFGIPFKREFVSQMNCGYGIFSAESNNIDLLVSGIPKGAYL